VSSNQKFYPSNEFSENAHFSSMEQYEKLYQESIKDPSGFWTKQAERLHWYKKWDDVVDFDFVDDNIKWFSGGKHNVSYN
jgi:acetyl-CoA synthetase